MKFLKIYKKIKIDEDRKFFFETRHQIVNTMLREEMKKNRICIRNGYFHLPRLLRRETIKLHPGDSRPPRTRSSTASIIEK